MKKLLKVVAPLVIATGIPFVGAGIATATPLSITSCSLTPSTITLAPGESRDISVAWEDGVNTPGASGAGTYVEMSLNGGTPSGYPTAFSGATSNPYNAPYDFAMLSGALSGQAGTVKFSFYATDGTSKVGSELCSLTASVAAAPVATTTTVPPTLPHTGSNASTLFVGGAMVLAVGGALYVSGRRRSIK